MEDYWSYKSYKYDNDCALGKADTNMGTQK